VSDSKTIHTVGSYTGEYQEALWLQATAQVGDEIHYRLGRYDDGSVSDTWSVDGREQNDVDRMLRRLGLGREWSGTEEHDGEVWDVWVVVGSEEDGD